MSNARKIADLLDSNGDVNTANLDNVPASDNASLLSSGTIPAARIGSSSITNAKLAADAVDGTKIADNSIGLEHLVSGTDGNLITYDASGDPAYVTTGTSGQVLTSGGTGVAPTFQAAAGGADTSLSNLSATGEQMVCKAWVRFVGTGTVAIHDSFNVSSITDVGTGQYTVNLTTAMANANYAAVASCARYWDGDNATTNIVSSSQYTVTTYDQGSTFKDNLAPTSIVFGD